MRTLVLNLGNTSLFAGVFSDDRLTARFRVPIRQAATAQSFARLIARRVRGRIDCTALCSVVPALTTPVARYLERTFGVAPLVLTADAPHGLKIGYRRPRELGTDRLAAALGAQALFRRQNVIVVDCGTATEFCPAAPFSPGFRCGQTCSRSARPNCRKSPCRSRWPPSAVRRAKRWPVVFITAMPERSGN